MPRFEVRFSIDTIEADSPMAAAERAIRQISGEEPCNARVSVHDEAGNITRIAAKAVPFPAGKTS